METTLFKIQTGSSFWFGGFEFIKQHDGDELFKGSPESFCQCEIAGTGKIVYVSDAAIVKTEA